MPSEPSDVVERLRKYAPVATRPTAATIMDEAATLIEQQAATIRELQAEVAEARAKALDEAAGALEADAQLCDCFARSEGECGCGAWSDYKTVPMARAVEIVRNLKGTDNG